MPNESPLSRRRLLELLSLSSLGGIAGCSEQAGESSQTPTDTSNTSTIRKPTQEPTPTLASTPTESPESTETPRENPDTLFVNASSSFGGDGTKEDPLQRIQSAINRAQPGETIYVEPGRYEESLASSRSGKPGEPISIIGPSDAIVVGYPYEKFGIGFEIRHSHIHLDGLTFDGLNYPEEPKRPTSYLDKNFLIHPFAGSEEYLTDLKIKPNAVGNTIAPPVRVIRTKNSEIGEFELIGPAGVGYLYGDQQGHNGEIVKIGEPPDGLEPGEGIDQSHDIHVHHIANTEGHPHNELVEAEPGTYNILIEYCTDAGGSAKFRRGENGSPSGEAAMGLRGGSATLRWSVITNSHGAAVDIGVGGVESEAEAFEEVPDERFPGKNNSIYRNRLKNNRGIAIKYETVGPGTSIDAGPEDQKAVCENEYDGETMDEPGRECPDWVPQSDTIGHLGGDSPWT